MVWRILGVVFLVSFAVGVVVERAVTGVQTHAIGDVSSCDSGGGGMAIAGHIVYAGENRFVLSDGTGKAELATCPLWYKQVDLRCGDKVVVVGEVMSIPPTRLECRFVLSVRKVYRGDGVIIIRELPGKPPWIDPNVVPGT